MPITVQELKALRKLAKLVGCRLVVPRTNLRVLNRQRKIDLEFAPFGTLPSRYCLGLNFEKRIVYTTLTPRAHDIIHELAHIAASQTYPGDDRSFLGWEFAAQAWIARELGMDPMTAHIDWRETSDYGLNDHGDSAIELTDARLKHLVASEIAKAKRRKRVSENGTPLSVR
jgi:hypothetical protein